MVYITLVGLEARLGFQAEPKLSHQCELAAAQIRNSKPALKIRAEPCSHWRLSSGFSELGPEPRQCEMPQRRRQIKSKFWYRHRPQKKIWLRKFIQSMSNDGVFKSTIQEFWFPFFICRCLSSEIFSCSHTQGSASDCIFVSFLSARYLALTELKKKHPMVEQGALLSKLVAYSSPQGC